jgi:membrane fusion protein (multidrug efflux system)
MRPSAGGEHAVCSNKPTRLGSPWLATLAGASLLVLAACSNPPPPSGAKGADGFGANAQTSANGASGPGPFNANDPANDGSDGRASSRASGQGGTNESAESGRFGASPGGGNANGAAPGGRPNGAGAGGGPGMGGGFGGGPQSVGVITAAASQGTVGLEIEAIGNAVANESAEITSKTLNTVTAIRFQEGQWVKRGAVLVEFDGAQARADLAAAEAALAESRSQFKRSQELLETKVLSQSQMDTLEATLKTNEAKVTAARARLEDTIIRAPFDGRLGFRRISVGGLVNPGTVISTLDDTSVMKLDFTVPQSYMFGLSPGLPIKAQIAGVPDKSFTGRITTLDSRVDPVTRSIVVRAELPNKDGTLKPGMFMTAKINAAAAQALLIPEGALVPEQGHTFVFVVKNGVAMKREVTIGHRRPGEVQVTTGLDLGERVVVEGTQKIRDGAAVLELDAGPATMATS